MTKELQAITIPAFLNKSRDEQSAFLQGLTNYFRIPENRKNPLLKKYVALVVLMEARCAAEDKSSFNLTAQFRNFLAFFGLEDLKLGADRGNSHARTMYSEEKRTGDIAINGYRLFHISNMGHRIWTRKFFNIGLDKDHNILTQKVRIQGKIGESPEPLVEDMELWETLNRDQLKALFATIKEESSYENTFGYDLLCAGMYCANGLLLLNYLCATEGSLGCGLLLLPFALALSLAIYAVTLPPALTFMAIEYCIVEPIKLVVKMARPDKYEAFIEAVTSAPDDGESDEEIRAEELHQGL